jgi:predicted Zn-dependent peptidase
LSDQFGAKVTKLANGLTVATDRMPSVSSASLGIWIGVGTRHEHAEENGLAHLIEHMVFKGTSRRDAAAIAREIEDVGGHMNAYTSREQTAYYARVLSDDLPLAVDLIADIVQDSLYDTEELSRERTVILQEIAQVNDTPDDVIFDHFQEIAFPDQPLGRPVLGKPDVVRSVERDRLVNYIDTNYGPGSSVLSASGDVDHDALVELVGKRFDHLPGASKAETQRGAYKGGEMRVKKDLDQLHFTLGFRGVSYSDPDFYALQVLSTLYGGGMSSRLFQEVREKRGLVYSIHSFTSCYMDDGIFGVYAGTGPDEIGEVVPIVCDELLSIGDTLQEGELARARVQLKASLLMSRESTSTRCEQLANHLLVHGRPVDVDDIVAKVEAVDEDMIRRLVARLLETTPTMVAVGAIQSLESYDAIRARLG